MKETDFFSVLIRLLLVHGQEDEARGQESSLFRRRLFQARGRLRDRDHVGRMGEQGGRGCQHMVVVLLLMLQLLQVVGNLLVLLQLKQVAGVQT